MKQLLLCAVLEEEVVRPKGMGIKVFFLAVVQRSTFRFLNGTETLLVRVTRRATLEDYLRSQIVLEPLLNVKVLLIILGEHLRVQLLLPVLYFKHSHQPVLHHLDFRYCHF
jgi:hypothetical protein